MDSNVEAANMILLSDKILSMLDYVLTACFDGFNKEFSKIFR
jgi:hypothetical protein